MKLCILAAVAVLFVVVAVAEPVPLYPLRFSRGAESKDKAESEKAKSDADKSMQKPSSMSVDSPPSHPDEDKQDAHTHIMNLSHHSSSTPKPRVSREADSKEDKSMENKSKEVKSMENKSKEDKTDADAPIKKLVPQPIAPRDPNSRVRREPYWNYPSQF